MIKVKLYTGDDGYVVTAIIPPFDPMPDILLWGARVFKYVTHERYNECFAVAVVKTEEFGDA
jgi:hypothetical protein